MTSTVFTSVATTYCSRVIERAHVTGLWPMPSSLKPGRFGEGVLRQLHRKSGRSHKLVRSVHYRSVTVGRRARTAARRQINVVALSEGRLRHQRSLKG